MRLLLDTCTFLWVISSSPRLSTQARDLFRDPDNEVFLSVVSAWEIAMKFSMGSLALPASPLEIIPQERERHGITSLPLTEEAALYLPKLPKLHRDPFDRMLVCQAITNSLAILTPDALVSQYGVLTIW